MQVICLRENHEYRWKFVDGKNPKQMRKCLSKNNHSKPLVVQPRSVGAALEVAGAHLTPTEGFNFNFNFNFI